MSDRCLVCRIEKPEHDKAEVLRTVNHKFSVNGELEALSKTSPKKAAPPRPQIMVVGAVDVNLRELLHKKGILTDEDLSALLDPGASAAGDSGNRSSEGTD